MAKVLTIEDFSKAVPIEEHQEQRKDWHHRITHLLAFIVISSFLMLQAYLILFSPHTEIPDYLISIVSTIIGFYFAKNMFQK